MWWDRVCVCGGIEKCLCLFMLLRRFAYPCGYSDLISRFVRPVPENSMMSNEVMEYIYNIYHHRLTKWNDLLLNYVSLQAYADAVFLKGAPLENCFGFIDGSVRPISLPCEHQRLVYNGRKRVHSLKFQSVALPNEMIANL